MLPVVTEFVKLVSESDENDNIISVILFGSYARGDYDADSDIDILIILKRSDSEISDSISGMSDKAMESNEYEDFLSIIQLSDKQWKEAEKMSTPFYNTVSKEGIVLWKK